VRRRQALVCRSRSVDYSVQAALLQSVAQATPAALDVGNLRARD
jgi:hypothetical protein